MLETFVRLSERFPPVEMTWKGRKKLHILMPKANPGRYVSLALALSAFFSLITLALALSLGLPYLLALPAFACAAMFFLYLPEMEMGSRIADIESSMPFFLRTLGMLLEMGLPFRRAMETACEGEGTLQDEMKHVLREWDGGISFQRAMIGFGIMFDSPAIKRTVSQLLSAYETGSTGHEIVRIGDDLLALEQHRLKEYASRGSVFGLMFIMTSAIAPTFFLVYAIAGRFAMAQRLEMAQITIAMLVLFPMVSILLLILSKATMPRSAFQTRGFDPVSLAPGIVVAAGFIIAPEYGTPVLVLGLLSSFYMIWQSYPGERRAEELECRLPDALFSVSGMPKATRTERIFEMVESGGYGPLSEEAGKSRAQLEMNVRLGEALEDLWLRNRSPMLKRTCLMLRHMIESNSIDRLGMLADDMTKALNTVRERAQTFAMQKYTLMFGALLIPLIMKMTICLLGSIGGMLAGGSGAGSGIAGGSGMDSGVGGSFGIISGSGDDISVMVAYALSIVPPYLVIYAMIASAAISDAEGKRSAGGIYFALMCLISLAIFSLINL
jgi:Flp pilus assembly protein TadB